ncbi:MAG: bifunctional 5,10-methylenetetrahydrofolate dehydrogenase/5,10-methenyltetrahydrofolate cyclohydrolase [Spirochaetaceae bacterium]|jgi:methylenetetrahydrofolate dehydrogenase (NADP+)/methenyltetrahydrofolate cyclohydrolase|nr:bifunctional 5,10-methylenetetrahydrofolate dehydrogenase/5,10-methenyltetrahydrofolate cyclohydrolase [Spirochaetaceae bacterium]
MGALILDGSSIAGQIREEIRREALLAGERGIAPFLAVVLVGDDPASVSYVAGKEKALSQAGLRGKTWRLPADTTEGELLALVERLNRDPSVHGILVQFPLPPQIDENAVLQAISPDKDVDGLTPFNLGLLASGRPAFVPCTPQGVLALLQKAGVAIPGSNTVIVGRSGLVGRPLSILLSSKPWNATVTLCHTGTGNLADHTRRADILVAACGVPGFITAEHIKPGAAVIDVGVNRVPDSSKKSGFALAGDVDFAGAREIASVITPVPGGVGPMTITMLLKNTLRAALRQQ